MENPVYICHATKGLLRNVPSDPVFKCHLIMYDVLSNYHVTSHPSFSITIMKSWSCLVVTVICDCSCHLLTPSRDRIWLSHIIYQCSYRVETDLFMSYTNTPLNWDLTCWYLCNSAWLVLPTRPQQLSLGNFGMYISPLITISNSLKCSYKKFLEFLLPWDVIYSVSYRVIVVFKRTIMKIIFSLLIMMIFIGNQLFILTLA